MISIVEENYLKALYNISAESGEVNVSDLSEHLKIKMPTVTSMMKKLAQKELVHYESYKPITLTEKGRKSAALIIRKHRLTEMFLVEKMGFGWEQVHEIAEQVEHIQSPVFFERMDEILDYPTVDPHGSPIPDTDGTVRKNTFTKLSACGPGEKVKFCAVNNTSNDFLKFLNSRELKLGLSIHIHSIEPFDKSMVVSYGRRKNETLSAVVSERMLVERTETN